MVFCLGTEGSNGSLFWFSILMSFGFSVFIFRHFLYLCLVLSFQAEFAIEDGFKNRRQV